MFTTTRQRFALTCLTVLSLAMGACEPPQSAEEAPGDRVDAIFAAYTAGVQPGIAVEVIRNGKVIHRGTYGYADIANEKIITAETAFRLASVSKQFAAMAIMLLAEEGKLSYDDPIAKYLPELQAYEGVTIRHLMLHTGGLPDYYDNIDTSAGMPTNHDAILLLGKMAHPDFSPGDHFEYSNAGYDTLGPIVEAVSGISFAEFVRKNIFLPLGMTHSVVHDDRLPAVRNRAIGYDPADGFVLDNDDPLNAIIGSGGIYSTLDDLFLWDQALYGESLVSKATLDLAFTSGTNNAGESLDYGFGWRIDEYAGHKVLRHGGSWVGFRTHILRIPDLQFSVILLSNRSDTDAEKYVDQVAAIYLD
jgi:CubicO group peptidase (beta-lactamase class C family)